MPSQTKPLPQRDNDTINQRLAQFSLLNQIESQPQFAPNPFPTTSKDTSERYK